MHDKPLARGHAHLLAEGLDGVFLFGLLGRDLLGDHLGHDRGLDKRSLLLEDLLHDGLSLRFDDLLDDLLRDGIADVRLGCHVGTFGLEDERRRRGGVSGLGGGGIGHGCQGSCCSGLIRR